MVMRDLVARVRAAGSAVLIHLMNKVVNFLTHWMVELGYTSDGPDEDAPDCPNCPTTILTTRGTNAHVVVIACQGCGHQFSSQPRRVPAP